ncbi:MAG: PfkB family carbohydrate kinase [Pseudomonadota bacterium]
MSVFVCGALHWDLLIDAPRLPGLDETLAGTGAAQAFGGKGGNQALAAVRHGAQVAMAGRVGDDDPGRRMRAALTEAGVETAQIQRGGGASGLSAAIVTPDGAYGAVIVSGENRAIDPARIVLPEDTRILVLQQEIPVDVNRALARRARAVGARVMLNAAPARGCDLAPDLLVVNRVEVAQLTGITDPQAAAADLAKDGPVIVTLGADGLILAAEDRLIQHPARPVDMISSHGAGDAFVGALAARLAAGDALEAAADYAQTAAALHVSTRPEVRGRIGPAQVRAFQDRR